MKSYNGEKAIISLTTWKARINTVGKTLYSLIKNCPGFHIVLVLSEEEFPRKEKELPEELMLFVNNDLIEILWVYKNYKAFKKVLFTMDKYRDVPVISADDDYIYIKNYAQELYNVWQKNKDSFVTYKTSINRGLFTETWGFATLHPPYAYKEYGLKYINSLGIEKNECTRDDMYYSVLREIINKKKIICLGKGIKTIAFTNCKNNSLYDTRIKLNNGDSELKKYLNLTGIQRVKQHP